jgi:hypothetical protein
VNAPKEPRPAGGGPVSGRIDGPAVDRPGDWCLKGAGRAASRPRGRPGKERESAAGGLGRPCRGVWIVPQSWEGGRAGGRAGPRAPFANTPPPPPFYPLAPCDPLSTPLARATG